MRVYAFVIAIACFLGALLPAHLAGAMLLDVSTPIIKVNTGFTGAGITVFGTQAHKGDVVIVIEGPARDLSIRQKSKVMGMWTNTDSHVFEGMPSFYEYASSAPIAGLAETSVLRAHRIGFEALFKTTQHDDAFQEALIDIQVRKQMYGQNTSPLLYVGPKLFKARFTLPALVVPGAYYVHGYVLRGGVVVESAQTSFNVLQAGTSAEIRHFADKHGLLYGLSSVVLAIFMGWLATVLLKRE